MCWHCWPQSSLPRHSYQSLPASRAARAANAVVHHPILSNGILAVHAPTVILAACRMLLVVKRSQCNMLCRSRWSAAEQGA